LPDVSPAQAKLIDFSTVQLRSSRFQYVHRGRKRPARAREHEFEQIVKVSEGGDKWRRGGEP
jgi:hypothetical protein